MKPALIKLTRRIILNDNTKHPVLRKIYLESIEIVIEILDYTSNKSWTAMKSEQIRNNIHKELNSDNNSYLKSVAKNYSDLTIGPDNSFIKVENGKIQVLAGNIDDRKSFEFALYLTLQQFTLLNSFDNSILVSIGNQIENLVNGVDTFLLQLGEEYNIIYYQSTN